ncbi:hypothetical protein PoB_006174100 [Plakobranchus ocellatus]|uniref:Uncharacterized protein n=1 Tax=Plakobranchus ocellatus TaxID=259542 RepID=A0AAV4CU52_9GAST|nr:hypothetical protein PoB_006174100 [Plakobranchus ocellatus]
MSDLEEIAAEAHIVIVDTSPNDGGDGLDNAYGTPGHSNDKTCHDAADSMNVQELEALFSNRYTDLDPEYRKLVEEAEALSKPPCVQDFFVRRQRDGSRNWNRHRGPRPPGGSGDRNRSSSREDYRDRYRHSNHTRWAGGDNRAHNQYRDRGYNTYRRNDGNDYRGRERERSPHR